ncbi:hypothetical protein EVAR_5447_1 [Eumeta japonica]|uniref:Uncharacterized protein n=1 Tax=Eumeta variegata TaxID=151549 RepID=A0A4C1T9Q4_EUMVA|nr:hypothetical protein EVAR_5447_1 [Eumeta japonica]
MLIEYGTCLKSARSERLARKPENSQERIPAGLVPGSLIASAGETNFHTRESGALGLIVAMRFTTLVLQRGEARIREVHFGTLNTCVGMNDKIEDVCEMKNRRLDTLCMNDSKREVNYTTSNLDPLGLISLVFIRSNEDVGVLASSYQKNYLTQNGREVVPWESTPTRARPGLWYLGGAGPLDDSLRLLAASLAVQWCCLLDHVEAPGG